MTKRKAILSGILAATTALSLCGCNNANPNTSVASLDATTSTSSSAQAGNTNSNTSSAASSTDATSSTTSETKEPEAPSEDNIFSDFEKIQGITSVVDSEMSLSLAVANNVSIDTKISFQGTADLMQIDIPSISIEMKMPETTDGDSAPTSSAPQTMTISDLSLIIDTKNSKAYIKEDSYKNLLSMSGMPISYDDPAEWISDTVEVTLTEGNMTASGQEAIEKFVTEAFIPEVTEALVSVQDSFLGADKHSLKLDNANIPVFIDAMIKMCDDGSMLNIYNAAEKAGLLNINLDNNTYATGEAELPMNDGDNAIQAPVKQTPEEAVAALKEQLTTAKEQLSSSESPAKGAIEVKTSVSGEKGSYKADITFTVEGSVATEAEETSIKCTLDLSANEGTANITIPTAVVDVDAYMQAVQEAMSAAMGGSETRPTIEGM